MSDQPKPQQQPDSLEQTRKAGDATCHPNAEIHQGGSKSAPTVQLAGAACLDAAIAAAQKPLVDALKQIRYASAPIPQATTEQIAHQPIEAHRIAIDALAKWKENK